MLTTHTHPFNGPLSRTTRVSRYRKDKTNLDFTEARDSECQWRQLGHMQVCTMLQTDNHANTSPLSFLPAGCPSCHPTNSVKALKAYYPVYIWLHCRFWTRTSTSSTTWSTMTFSPLRGTTTHACWSSLATASTTASISGFCGTLCGEDGCWASAVRLTASWWTGRHVSRQVCCQPVDQSRVFRVVHLQVIKSLQDPLRVTDDPW